ncbi:MAG TPA: ROK family protein [Candidatus Saccharimonadales bacterium]|nr:ROK family protein [Candidatus Saccharimonadales bacterium]
MYLAVDIGGTKTLVATIGDDGVIEQQHRFATPQDYESLLDGLRGAAEQFSAKQFQGGGVGVPGHIDYEHGVSVNSPHVEWGNVPLRDDCAKIFGCPFVIDNDANMAALSEAMLHKDCETVLYFTVSTGIGTGLVRHQRIDPALLKSEGGHIVLPYKDKLMDWEDFASGKAIYERYGKKAVEITNEDDWRDIAHNLALGFFAHIAILQPDMIIVGGSIGTHFDRYSEYLMENLKRYEVPIVPIPPIVKALRPEEAVVFGCYDAAQQKFQDGDDDGPAD